jgi:hypothetical protein
MPMMMPSSAANGVVKVTPVPLQTPLMTVGLMSTIEHVVSPTALPLYLNPFDPAGLPSAVQPSAGSGCVKLPPPNGLVSKKLICAPTELGSVGPEGSGNVPVGLETNLASLAGFTSPTLAGIVVSITPKAAVVMTRAAANPTNVNLARIGYLHVAERPPHLRPMRRPKSRRLERS